MSHYFCFNILQRFTKIMYMGDRAPLAKGFFHVVQCIVGARLTRSNWRQLKLWDLICLRATAPAYCHHMRALAGLSGLQAGLRWRLGARAEYELKVSSSFCRP